MSVGLGTKPVFKMSQYYNRGWQKVETSFICGPSPSWFVNEPSTVLNSDMHNAQLKVLKTVHKYLGAAARRSSVCSMSSADRDDEIQRHDNSSLRLELLRKNESAEFQAIFEMRQKLPVIQQCRDILRAIRGHQVVLVVGRRGCGKTTQIPQMLLDDSIFNNSGTECGIVCIQTNKASAISAAKRVAYERVESLGNSVGFQVGGRKTMPRETGFILYGTSGILIKHFRIDPMLSNLTVVILDDMQEKVGEFNQLMELLQIILPHRPDLKVILFSTTVSEDTFCNYFKNYHAIYIHETLYPIITKTSSISTERTPDFEIASTISDGEPIAMENGDNARNNYRTSRTYLNNYQGNDFIPIYNTKRRLIKKNRQRVNKSQKGPSTSRYTAKRVRTNYQFHPITIKRRRSSSNACHSNLQVAIIDRSDPHGRISKDMWLKIEEMLLAEIISSKWSDEKISFEGANWSKGVKTVYCGNNKSLDFLKATVESWPRVRLEVIPRSELPLRTFASMWIPPPVPSTKVMLALIEKQNNGIDTKSWKILKCTSAKNDFGKDYRICIDGKSLKMIRACYGRIQFGLNYIRIRIHGIKKTAI